jgi:hypothetical protein
MTTKQDASLIIDAAKVTRLWCAYEHSAQFEPGKPPEVVFVGVTKLTDVYRLIEGQRNSEWLRIFGHGGAVLVHIIGTGESRSDMMRMAMERAKSFPTLPRCNMHGVNLKGTARRIICSNGKTYESQKEAADSLGISSSSISRHLRSELKSVGGYTFAYEVSQ